MFKVNEVLAFLSRSLYMKRFTIKKTISVVAASVLLITSSSVFAQANINTNECNLTLNNDLSISPDHVRIIEDDETIVDIYNDKLLFINGEMIDLDNQEQQMIVEYATYIRNAVPEVTAIALEAVTLAFDGLNNGLGNMVDIQQSEYKFDALKTKIKQKYQSGEGQYTITKGELNSDIQDEEIELLVEEIMEDMVPNIVGGLLTNIGQAISNGEDININLDADFERQIDERSELIELKASAFCHKMKKLDELEQTLISRDPIFEYLDLIDIDYNKASNEYK